MISRPRHSSIFFRPASVAVGVVLLSVFLLIVRPPMPVFLTSAVSTVASPFIHVKEKIAASFSGVGDFFVSKRHMSEEIAALQSENDTLRAATLSCLLIQNENDSLRSLMGNRSTRPPGVVATVLLRPPYTPYDSLFLDVGSENGVSVGDTVVVDGSIVLGEITEVFGHTSRAELFSSPGKETLVSVGSSHLSLSAVGEGGGAFSIRVPRETEVALEDIVSIPSLSGMSIGRIASVDAAPEDAFQVVRFRYAANFATLHFVEILSTPVYGLESTETTTQ